MTGRKTVLTPEVIRQFSGLLVLGISNKDACHVIGVSPASFYNWIVRGTKEAERLEGNNKAKPRKAEAIFLEFLEAIEKADSSRKATILKRIHDAGQPSYIEEEHEDQEFAYPNGKPLLVGSRKRKVKRAVKADLRANTWLAEKLYPDEFGNNASDWRKRLPEDYDPELLLNSLGEYLNDNQEEDDEDWYALPPPKK